MASRSDLRCFLVLSAVAMSAFALVVGSPATAAESVPTPTTTTSPAQQQSQQALLDQDKLDTSSLNHALRGRTAPFIYAQPGTVPPTLVLPASSTPYEISTLATTFSSAFDPAPGGGVILEIPLEVGPGATLNVTRSSTPALYLRSTPTGYVHVTVVEGALDLAGTAAAPLTIASIDPSTYVSDSDTADGRAYISTEGGTMNLHHVHVSDLGYLTGVSSGVAWIPYAGTSPTGGATSSSFTGNYFGAYASNTRSFVASDDVFSGNVLYGLDLHDRTNDARITTSKAEHNGSHGFSLNRGCVGDQFTDVTSSSNGGAGFPINSNHTQGGQVAIPSSETSLTGVTAVGNLGAGVLVHGGHGNSVTGSTFRRNQAGVLVVGAATDAIVEHDVVTNSKGPAIEVAAGSTNATIESNRIDGATTGISSNEATPTTIAHNEVTGIVGTGIKLVGTQGELHLNDNRISGTGAAPIFLNAEPLTSFQGTTVVRWSVPGPNRWIRPFELALWALILIPPVLFFARGRRRKRSKLAAHQEAP